MYKNKSICIVVPAYQEEFLINKVIDSAPAFVDKIVVVDDASADRTAAIVADYAKKQPQRVYLLQHSVNQGVGGAIATGYKWCRDNGIDVAVVMAGDAQMDPDDMEKLLDPVVNGEADYSKGNRLFTGEAWQKIPRVRYLGNSFLSLMTKAASGYWHIADSQCGYTAINSKALKTIDWDKMYKRYGQPNDLLVRLNIFNFRVVDVPVRPIYNIGEESGIKPIRMIPKFFFLLVRLFIFRMIQKYVIRDFHPLVLFYVSAFAFLLLGLVFGIRFFLVWGRTGLVPEITLLIIVFCAFSVILFGLFAMLFDLENNRRS